MKKILLLTDFSENATHAGATAYELCKKMQMDLLLYHVYQLLPVTAFYGGSAHIGDPYTVLEEETTKKLSKLSNSIKALNRSHIAYEPRILYCSDGGNLGENVEKVLEKENIEFIVLGARSGGFIAHLLNGSDTRSVIRHSNRPVLVVTPKTKAADIGKIIFATDFNVEDFTAMRYLVKLAGILNLKLEVAHVSVNEDKRPGRAVAEIEFRKEMSLLPYQDLLYHDVQGKEVVTRLNQLCEEVGAGVLAMVHLNHDLFTRLFKQSTAYQALDHPQLSFMIFPSKFRDEN